MTAIKDEPSEVEDNYDNLHVEQNRRGKKAGGWQVLGLDHPVFKAIQKLGFKQPTPIQCKAIPPILDGKDVVAMSRTGSGKTAAFVIPMIQKLKQRLSSGTRALLLSPTRELALQTFSVVKQLAKFTGLRCACVVGGDNMEEQFSAIHENPDILIATPGRLLHLAVEMNMKLNTVRYIVFDEADRLFELGFAEQLHDILKRLSESRQTMLFSATLPKILVDFAKAGLSDPTLVRLDADTKISEKLSMVFFACRDNDKTSALLYLARKAVREQKQTIIFCATMKHVEYFSTILTEAGLDVCFLYSQLDASARKMNISRFRNKQCMLLVVTDVAARGVDIPLMDNAINVHFPAKSKLFIHRVGRVARAGKFGTSYSLVSPDEMPYVLDLFLFLGRPLKLAVDSDEYKVDETLMGSFPDDLVHLETEFLRNIHEISMEVSDLKHKSDNAMKKYIRTRPAPSSESVRRSKKEFKTLECAPHPILDKSISMSADHSVLQELRNYRPPATIFELNANSKVQTVNIMKAKRKAHQKIVEKNKKSQDNIDESEEEASADETGVIESFDNVVKVTKVDMPEDVKVAASKAKKRKYDEQKERDKMEHYVSYRAADDETEKGYAVDNNANSFDALAKNSSVDIIADDDKGLYREKGKKKWDRKTKKYVGEQSVKRIRTEEGTLVPASYKSGRYEKWQSQQKMKYRNDDDEGEDDGNNRSHHARSHKKVWHTKENNKRGPRDEVKRPEEIFKARRTKEKIQGYQEHRRQDNLKRKVGSLQKKRSGPGSFKGGNKPAFGGRSGGKPSFGGRPRGRK
uniref:RNA helicase n=1 Tax=Panagrolaimus superbus TaxID=310955 RepID=A0A914YDF8_9BILA